MEKICMQIKKMRENAGLRQEQIADFLGVTQTYISKIESGERNITADQLEALAGLYGYDMSTFENEDNMQSLQFAYRAQDITTDDLHAIAEIGQIANNSRMMARILGEDNDR